MTRVLAVLLGAMMLVACSQNEQKQKPALTKEKAELSVKKILPDATLVSLNNSPVQGLSEMVVERKGIKGLAYIDQDAKVIIIGRMLDVENKKDLTEERFKEVTMVDFKQIPLASSLQMGAASPKDKMVVFTDPDCEFCAKYHDELKKLVAINKELAVYIFIAPNIELHPDAYGKSRSIMCAKGKDASLKMLDDAFKKKKLPLPDCDTKTVDEHMVLARKIGVTATPTTILDDDTRIDGMVTSDALIKYFLGRRIKEAGAVGNMPAKPAGK